MLSGVTMATSVDRPDRTGPSSGTSWEWKITANRLIGPLDLLLVDDVGLVDAGLGPGVLVDVVDLDHQGPALGPGRIVDRQAR